MELPSLTQASRSAMRADGPKGTLVWGSLAEFRKDSAGFLLNCARDHGEISRIRFGPITAHLLNHPDHVQDVMVRRSENFDKKTRSVAMIRETCGDSLLSAHPQAWGRHRALIQPVFQPKFLTSIDTVVDACLDEMFSRWKARNQPIDIVAEMMQFMIVTSSRILFSSEVDTQRIEAVLGVLLSDTWRRLEAPFDLSFVSPMFHKRAFKDAVAEINAIMFQIIAERRAGGTSHDDLLSRLLEAHEQKDETGFSDRELRDASVTLLLAGHETTASALASTFWSVGQNPNQGFQQEEPQKLFQEALRLYPSIWIVERRAVRACEIGGFHIPKGSSVLISPYVLHRNEAFWDKPEIFDPSRFNEERIADRPRHAYIPFGLGQHRCVGLHMANRIAARVLERVYERFDLELVPGQASEMHAGITLRHAKPVLFKTVAR